MSDAATSATINTPAEQWAVVELMGHVRLGGRLTEVEMFGSKMGRLDVPNGDGFATKLFSGASVYAISFVNEAAARAVAAAQARTEPLHSWELPRQLPAAGRDRPRGGYDDEEPHF